MEGAAKHSSSSTSPSPPPLLTPQDRLRLFVQRFPLDGGGEEAKEAVAGDGAAAAVATTIIEVSPSFKEKRFGGLPVGARIGKQLLIDGHISGASPGSDTKKSITGRVYATLIPVPLPGSPVAIHYLLRTARGGRILATTLDWLYYYSSSPSDSGVRSDDRCYIGGTDEPALMWLLYHNDAVSLGAWGRGKARAPFLRPLVAVAGSKGAGEGGEDDDADDAFTPSVLPGILHFAVSTMRQGEVARFKIPLSLLMSTLPCVNASFLAAALVEQQQQQQKHQDDYCWFDVCLEGAEEHLPAPPSLLPPPPPPPPSSSSAIEMKEDDVGSPSLEPLVPLCLPDIPPGKTRKQVADELQAYRASLPPPLKQRLLAAMRLKEEGNALFKKAGSDSTVDGKEGRRDLWSLYEAPKKSYDSALAQCFVGGDEWLYAQHDPASDDDYDDEGDYSDTRSHEGEDSRKAPLRFGLSNNDKRRLTILKLQLHLNRAAVHLKKFRLSEQELEKATDEESSAGSHEHALVLLKEAEKSAKDAEWDCEQALALLPSPLSRFNKPLSAAEKELLQSLLETNGAAATTAATTTTASPTPYEAAFLGLEGPKEGKGGRRKLPPFDFLSSRQRAIIRKASSLLAQATVMLGKARNRQFWDEEQALGLVAQAESLLSSLCVDSEVTPPPKEAKAMLTSDVPVIRRRIKEELAKQRQKARQAGSRLAGALLTTTTRAPSLSSEGPQEERAKAGSGAGSAAAAAGGDACGYDDEMPPLLDC